MKGIGIWTRKMENPREKSQLFAVVFQEDEDIIGEIEQVALDRHLHIEYRPINLVPPKNKKQHKKGSHQNAV